MSHLYAVIQIATDKVLNADKVNKQRFQICSPFYKCYNLIGITVVPHAQQEGQIYTHKNRYIRIRTDIHKQIHPYTDTQ